MEIRDMESKDYPEIDRLMKELHELHVKGRPDLYTELEHPYSREEFEKIVSEPEIIAILAEEKSVVIGLCIGTLRKKSGMVEMKTMYIEDLIVDRNFRGKGIASQLYEEMEERGRNTGAKRLDLMVWEFNSDAKRFYEKQGMRPQRYIYEKEL
ncbi:MAG TPA: GNAT family N-acetyltransferase [Candidatus Blautia ornithocaccae]|nr:GNAT family N-acetyltransferase [Candidatus Blautia ornithocaccae]